MHRHDRAGRRDPTMVDEHRAIGDARTGRCRDDGPPPDGHAGTAVTQRVVR